MATIGALLRGNHARHAEDQRDFRPQGFLAKVGEGKTILEFRKGQVVFIQGDVPDTIFYIQKGRVKVVVISKQGKEAVVGMP